MSLIVVKATFDAKAGVWVAESEDVPGLVTEAESIEVLLKKLPGIIVDLLEDDAGSEVELPVELVANASSRVTVRLA
jgi:predicted RNase H-like HicB family nuclease